MVVFERAEDILMEKALDTQKSVKNVCIHRTKISNITDTQKKLPSRKKHTFCQHGQVKVTQIVMTNIEFL